MLHLGLLQSLLLERTQKIVGMQTVPVNVTNVHDDSLTLESEKTIVYTTDDTFLLMNLNAKKMHIIGHGKAITPS